MKILDYLKKPVIYLCEKIPYTIVRKHKVVDKAPRSKLEKLLDAHDDILFEGICT